MRTHDGSVKKGENARFVADLFAAAVNSDEYREINALNPVQKVVVVTDNAPAHTDVEVLARQMLVADGVVNGNKLVTLRLAPYSPMLNSIEGCWSVLEVIMKACLVEFKQKFLVRGDFDSFTAHRQAILKDTSEESSADIAARLAWTEEHHCFRSCAAAERGEYMKLGK